LRDSSSEPAAVQLRHGAARGREAAEAAAVSSARTLSREPKIFGIGLSKTGTTSLAAALRRLGIATIDMPYDARTLEELKSGQFRLSILKRYQAVTDIPVAPYYAPLDRIYPGSKFILTVREKASWLRSVEEHWAFSVRWARSNRDFRRFSSFIRTVVYGGSAFDAERYGEAYDRHVAEVGRYFAGRGKDLLVLDVCGGEGYERLCPFLGLPVLDEPFPRSNGKEEKPRHAAWIEHADGALHDLPKEIDRGESILIDGGQLAGTHFESALRPMDSELRYSPPADAEQVLREVERLTQSGCRYLVVAFPCFWWFEQYGDLRRRLGEVSGCLVDTRHIVVFDFQNVRVRAMRGR
jgi:hypothetical protein